MTDSERKQKLREYYADREEHGHAPYIYVPRGYTHLKKAVIETANKIVPEAKLALYFDTYLLAKMYVGFDTLRISRLSHDPFCDIPPEFGDDLQGQGLSHEDVMRCLSALRMSKTCLRAALAERDLVAHGQSQDGGLSIVRDRYWRTENGGWRLEIPDRVDEYSQVFIATSELSGWHAQIPDDMQTKLARSDQWNGHNAMPDAINQWQVVTWIRRRMDIDENHPTKEKYLASAISDLKIIPALFNRAWPAAIEIEPYKSMIKVGRPRANKAASKSPN